FENDQKNRFDLAFVEFTERGAVFDEDRRNDVLEKIKKKATADGSGVVTVVYVHGWKNNAKATNGNVLKFRELLDTTARLMQTERDGALSERPPRELVGVYVGWRGSSVELPLIKQLSYWDRKAVAEEVGKGGVTEFLLRLEQILRDDEDPNKNLFLVTGHSMGAAVLLTGLNEIFLERLIDQGPDRLATSDNEQTRREKTPEGNEIGCVTTRPFGHGVVLLNPAIETSEMLQLKQLVANTCFGENQERFMHVISSNADSYTTSIFEVAQWLGLVVGRQHAEFTRNLGNSGEKRELTWHERKLDTNTIGNYKPFLTGYLFAHDRPDETDGVDAAAPPNSDPCTDPGDVYDYVAFKHASADCMDKHAEIDLERHVPIGDNEPLAFIKTDGEFIGDHNDVFNENVAAYLATILAESRYKRALQAEKNKIKAIEDMAAQIQRGLSAAYKSQEASLSPETEATLDRLKENARDEGDRIWRLAAEGPRACHAREKTLDDFDFGACFHAYHWAFCAASHSGKQSQAGEPSLRFDPDGPCHVYNDLTATPVIAGAAQ
ncbi:MAG: hypothetical protein ACR2RE_28240, partial [Geminicoccaceae bacterium]